MATSFEVSVTGFNLGTGESAFGTAKTWSLNPERVISVVDQTSQRLISYWWNKTQIANIYTSASLATIEGLLEGGTFLPTSILTSYNGDGVTLTGAAQSVIFMSRNIISFYDNGSSTTFINYNMGNTNVGTYIVNETYANVKTALQQSETANDFYASDGTVSLPSYTFTSETSSGIYRIGSNDIGFAVNGAKVQEWTTTGTAITGTISASGQIYAENGNVAAPAYSFTSDNGAGLYRIGLNDYGFAVNDTLIMEWAVSDITIGDAVNMNFGITTGTVIGATASQKLAFWAKTPVVQPTTAVATTTFVANTSGIADDTATFGGYKISQIVGALKLIGLLA